MAPDSLVGTWKLVSFEFRTADGQANHPFGPDPVGYIIYSEDGYVAVTFMHADRPPFAAGDLSDGTGDEKVAAIDTYLSYCARYEVREESVMHHVVVSLFPNWAGIDQERFFELEGNRLLLSTPPILVAGIQQTAHLILHRV